MAFFLRFRAIKSVNLEVMLNKIKGGQTPEMLLTVQTALLSSVLTNVVGTVSISKLSVPLDVGVGGVHPGRKESKVNFSVCRFSFSLE